jgi:anti-sigma factor RsiW
MHCGRTQNLLSAYVDRELSSEEAGAIESHLRACGACRAESAALQESKRALAGLAAVGPRDPSAFLASMRRRRAATAPVWRVSLFSWLTTPSLATAAAAACLVAGAVSLAAVAYLNRSSHRVLLEAARPADRALTRRLSPVAPRPGTSIAVYRTPRGRRPALTVVEH